MVKIITDTPASLLVPDLNIGRQNWDAPEHLALGQLQMSALFPTVALEAVTAPYQLPIAPRGLHVPEMQFPDPLKRGVTLAGEDFLNRRLFNDALIVFGEGGVLHESYRNGMQAEDRHVIHSCSKSLCSMLVAMAVDEGKMDRQVAIESYIPAFAEIPAWKGVTLQQVLDMQAGIEYSEDYTDPDAHYWRYARAAGYYPPLPGEEVLGIKGWMLNNLTARAARPGSEFSYNSCLTNILGMALEHVYGIGLAELFEQKLYSRVGAETEAYFNTDRYGFPIAEGQLNLRLRDFTRLGLLLLHGGRNLVGEQVLPASFIRRLTDVDKSAQRAYQAGVDDGLFMQAQYKEQYWVLDPQRQQFAMLGIHGQFAWFDLERQLLIAGVGSFPSQDGKLMMATLSGLWQTIAESL